MKVCIVYGSRSGNTRQLALTMADALRSDAEVELQDVEGARLSEGIDLLIIGGPTEGHGLTPPVKAFLDRAGSLAGLPAAAFDTRLAWPIWLSGSAARDIAARLEQAGAKLVTRPESFIVSMEPKLREGELERAGRWATSVAASIRQLQPA